MRRFLTPHPDTPGPLVRGVEVEVIRGRRISLRLGYAVRGDIGGVAVPRAGHAARRDGLWRHTCFEAFVRARAGDRLLRAQPVALDRMGGLCLRRLSRRHARRCRESGPEDRRSRRRRPLRAPGDSRPGRRSAALRPIGLASRPLGGDRGERRHQILLGARPSAGQARFPSCRLLRARTPAST